MASYEQVVKLENEKPDGVIRLVESNGFYRAYNKSAFLFHKVIAQHKVTRKFAKNINQEIVYVGFPVDSALGPGRRAQSVVNSSLGVLSHYDSYCVRRVLVAKSRIGELGRVSEDGLRFYPNALDWALGRMKRAQLADLGWPGTR